MELVWILFTVLITSRWKLKCWFDGGKTLEPLFHFYVEDMEYLIVKQPNH